MKRILSLTLISILLLAWAGKRSYAQSCVAEQEPNDSLQTAQPLTGCDTGALTADDNYDYFQLSITEEDSAAKFDLEVETDSTENHRLCLKTADNITLQCRSATDRVALRDLQLPTGDYIIELNARLSSPSAYTLSKTIVESTATGETEPNDDYRAATPYGDARSVSGRFVGQEWDIFTITIEGAPQLWRVQVIGEGVTDLRYLDSAGNALQSTVNQGERRTRLPHLMLTAGNHHIALKGTDSDYTLLAIPLGAPPADFERESNDSVGFANELPLNGSRSGVLYDNRDDDYYYFDLANPTNVRLTVAQGEQSNMRLTLSREGEIIVRLQGAEAGEPLLFESHLLEGEYTLFVDEQGSGTRDLYALRLDQLDPFLQLTDKEPNSDVNSAESVPVTLQINGHTSAHDTDYYLLPDLPVDTHLTVHYSGDVELRLLNAEQARHPVTIDAGILTTDEPLLSGTTNYLFVRGRGAYTLAFEFAEGVDPLPFPSPLDGTLTLTLPDETLAAFWRYDQIVTGSLSNETVETLALEFMSSDPRVTIAEPLAEIAAGAMVDVAVRISADTRPNTYQLSVRGTNAQNQFALGEGEVTVSAEGVVNNAPLTAPLPDMFIGGFNAALLHFGAEIITENPENAEEQIHLHDDYTPLSSGFYENIEEWPAVLAVDLVGEEAVPIVGVTLNSQSRGKPLSSPKMFEVWLSEDGETFTLALADEMENRPIEQTFPLPTPINATHAQLRILSTHDGGNLVSFGEWKVITPNAPTERIDIADPQMGGYVVDFQPEVSEGVARSVLLVDDRIERARPAVDQSVEIIYGFQHDRSAQIEQIEWVNSAESANPFQRVTVSVSNSSPIGPWQTIGTFETATQLWELDTKPFARYVRFTTEAQTERVWRDLPDVIHIWERANDPIVTEPTNPPYRSITNEWGHYQQAAIYEQLFPVRRDLLLESAEDDNDSRESATLLPPSTILRDTVQVGKDEDWFRIDIPAGQNAAIIKLDGIPSVDVAVEVQTIDGERLPTTSDNRDPAQRVVTATLPADTSTVYARVIEPPRSVIFTWDNSGSVSPYFNAIYRALTQFAEDVTAGEEEVHLLPFGSTMPLSEAWLDTPEKVQATLTSYPRTHGSSEAEKSLVIANDLLAFREGTRAIVVITDAESGYQPTAKMWNGFRAVQPRIFSLHVHSNINLGAKPANFQDKMQSWAHVNGGFYDWLRTDRELEDGFARAATWLRRPKEYGISAETAQIAPPGPGTLQLLSSATGDNAEASASLLGNTAVELIIDASGSMQQSLAGSTRIGIAKAVLDDIVANVLPDDVPVALRAFGNREGNYACRTDLEVPLAPLERENLRATIAAITPQTNANTAIAASLAQVGDDLASVTGPKIIILLTDGEETCDGDPAATIAALREQGIDVRVNIVGFAIDNDDLKATFAEWAQIGGGSYFDATNAEELSASLTQALRVSYRVLDSEGNVVGTGLVDDAPIELEAGSYSVVLETDGEPSYEVVVGGEEAVILRVQR